MAMSSDPEIGDEDRLPWLQTVEDEDEAGPPVMRVLLLVLLGLVVIAAVVFGYRWLQTRHGPEGNGELIAAQEGDYKVRPNDPGGMKVQGEGDSAVATSDGAGGATGTIDPSTAPEAPVAGTKASATPAAPVVAGKTATATIPASGGQLRAGTSVVQLGSFPSEAVANDAWGQISKQFGYLAGLGQSVQRANVGGRVVYRLRVNAGSNDQASQICGKLKAAGQACFVTTS